MKLSTRTRYGLRALVEIARHDGDNPLKIKNIAKNQDISIKYLEQLVAVLKAGGFIRSIRGAKGGYLLAKSAETIKIGDVFNTFEGRLNITTECTEDEMSCPRAADCVTREVWMQVQQAVDDVLNSITLADLVERAKEKCSVNYQI